MKKNNTQHLVVLLNGEFKIRQNLKPIGKLIRGRIASAKTSESVKQVFQGEIATRMKFDMLRSKILENLDKPDVLKQYEKEYKNLEKKEAGKKVSNFGSLKNINVRVIGYDENGQTIVEPAFQADEKLLIKIGYTIQE